MTFKPLIFESFWGLEVVGSSSISFKHSESFFAISDKKLFTWDDFFFVCLFCFEGKFQAREITEPFRKIRRRINDLRENVLYYWLHGYIQPSNLSSALITYGLIFFNSWIHPSIVLLGGPVVMWKAQSAPSVNLVSCQCYQIISASRNLVTAVQYTRILLVWFKLLTIEKLVA